MGLEPGDEAHAFNLTNANIEHGGDEVSLADVVTEQGAIVVFECNHCPYVVGSIERIENMVWVLSESTPTIQSIIQQTLLRT